MKSLLILTTLLCLSACSTSGPTPEEKALQEKYPFTYGSHG